MCVSMLQEISQRDYDSAQGAEPRGRYQYSLRDISRSVDTTHTLNDLLLEDERRFCICRSGFARLTILKGM